MRSIYMSDKIISRSNFGKIGKNKVEYVFSIVIVSILPYAEFGPSDPDYAGHFMKLTQVYLAFQSAGH